MYVDPPCRGGGLLTRLTYGRFQELVASGHMHALPTLLPGQWHAGLKAVKSILRRIFIKRDRAWKAYTKVRCWHGDVCCLFNGTLFMQRQQTSAALQWSGRCYVSLPVVCPRPVSPCLQAWAPVGMHKYHSFIEYVQLYPEYDFIMLGDNGQGDAMCADRVIMKAGKLGGGACGAMPVKLVRQGMGHIFLSSGQH